LPKRDKSNWTRRDPWFFAELALIDLTLAGYLLFIRLSAAKSNVLLTLRFEPDLGLLLVIDARLGLASLVVGCLALANQPLTAIKSRCDGKL
jgi:hypothetical protein